MRVSKTNIFGRANSIPLIAKLAGSLSPSHPASIISIAKHFILSPHPITMAVHKCWGAKLASAKAIIGGKK